MTVIAPTPISIESVTTRTASYTDSGKARMADPGALDAIVYTLRQELTLMVANLQLTPKELGLILGESLGGIVGASVQFALTKDESYYNAITAQRRAEIADKELEIATTNAEIAKAKLAQEKSQENVLLAQICDDIEKPLFETEIRMVNVPVFDVDGNPDTPRVVEQTSYRRDAKGNKIPVMENGEQVVTLQPVAGQIGKQKELLSEQVQAYKQRAANDYASLFVEAFAVQYSSNPSATATALVEAVNGAKLADALREAKKALDPTS